MARGKVVYSPMTSDGALGLEETHRAYQLVFTIQLKVRVMIRAVLKVSPSDCIISAFSECMSLSPFKGKSTTGDEKVKHLYCDHAPVGFVIGSNSGSCLFMSHLSCIGKNCACNHFASVFLFGDCQEANQFVDEISSYVRTGGLKYPFLAIWVCKGRCIALSHMSFDDFNIRELAEGSYYLRSVKRSK